MKEKVLFIVKDYGRFGQNSFAGVEQELINTNQYDPNKMSAIILVDDSVLDDEEISSKVMKVIRQVRTLRVKNIEFVG